MEVCRRSSWLLLLLGVSLLATTLQGVQGEAESEGPSESECRPYIEKALKELETGDTGTAGTPDAEDSKEDVSTVEITTDDSDHQDDDGDDDNREEGTESIESVETDQNVEEKQSTEQEAAQEDTDADGEKIENEEDAGASQEAGDTSPEEEGEPSVEEAAASQETAEEATGDSKEESIEGEDAADEEKQSEEDVGDAKSGEIADETQEQSQENQDTQEETEEVTAQQDEAPESQEEGEKKDDTEEAEGDSIEAAQQASIEDEQASEEDAQQASAEDAQQASAENAQQASAEDVQKVSAEEEQQASTEEEPKASTEASAEDDQPSAEGGAEETQEESAEATEDVEAQASQEGGDDDTKEDTAETTEDEQDEIEAKSGDSEEKPEDESKESGKDDAADDDKSDTKEDETVEEEEQKSASQEQDGGSTEAEATGEVDERSAEQDSVAPDEAPPSESAEDQTEQSEEDKGKESAVSEEDEIEKSEEGEDDSAPEEELSLDVEIPTDLRSRDHVEHLLKLDDEASETEKIINRVAEITLRELKKLYENAIKPLEVVYKYRDLSNRHFGDSEIFSKPLILFMGPWSGGKSSIINYLLDNEYNETSLKTGAEPSPAYFNILLHGDEHEIIDGTQLAADFTFSGLQKFGQGLEERLRGVKLPSKLLEKVNIVEIPGILEVRKQVSRVFPFNDACQWFIDRADIIFLVYDPSKLDVGPETEAILDQLKGREHQTRIILNKADQVKPEELMRVQGALIWNISPLMSSAQPPIMYTTSLWSRPYESWAPSRLLQAQERGFLRDLRSAVDKRIENKIASARRFAVRVRNHAKMVDCYLTTYYNHKSVFGNRKQVADEIIEHPQDYHIYEGLSTLTNISRYDLPDPDVYRDFFKLNPLYEFQQLSATCTYFRGCPINRLDVAIAYDLPELIGKHKRLVESALAQANQTPVPGS